VERNPEEEDEHGCFINMEISFKASYFHPMINSALQPLSFKSSKSKKRSEPVGGMITLNKPLLCRTLIEVDIDEIENQVDHESNSIENV
jgi:hypothetical protein